MTQDSKKQKRDLNEIDSDQEGPPEVIYLLWWDEVGLASPLDATWSKVRLNSCDIKYQIVKEEG